MAKLVLDWQDEQEDSFTLIGISCHQKDYRLCWELNQTLGIELQKEEDIPGPDEEISFSRYYFNNDDFLQEYYLLTNKIGKTFFAPELKQADYILQVYGLRNENETDDLVQKINGIDQVLMAFTYDFEKLKYGHPLFYTAIIKKKKENKDLLAAFRIKPQKE
jgi:hypothetical protein